MNYPVVVFDFDGTLADSFNPAIDYLFDDLLPKSPKLAASFSRDQLEEYRSYSIPELVNKLPHGWLHFIPLLLKVKKWHTNNLRLVSLYPEIPDLIRSLAENGYSMMILTSNSRANVSRILERYNLDQYITQIIPVKGIFNKAKSLHKLCKNFNLQATDIIYVGDEIRDVEACHAAGVKIISVSYGFNSAIGLKRVNPDYLVSRPSEIILIIDQLHDQADHYPSDSEEEPSPKSI